MTANEQDVLGRKLLEVLVRHGMDWNGLNSNAIDEQVIIKRRRNIDRHEIVMRGDSVNNPNDGVEILGCSDIESCATRLRRLSEAQGDGNTSDDGELMMATLDHSLRRSYKWLEGCGKDNVRFTRHE